MKPDLNIVTSLNPQHETIEIHPQEILQVVFTDREQLSWSFIDKFPKAERHNLHLRHLRWETFYNDGIERPKRGHFEVMSHSRTIGKRQIHHWFRLDPADYHKIERIKSGSFGIKAMRFHSGRIAVGELNVRLAIEDYDKEEIYSLIEETVWKGTDPIALEARNVGLTGRLIDEERGYALNPANNEQLIFELRQRKMLIEVAAPCGGHYKVGGFDIAKGSHFGMDVLADRTVNGKKLQRIMVTNLCRSMQIGCTRMRLGRIRLSAVDGDGLSCPRYDRILNFWVAAERDVTTEFPEDEAISENHDFDFDLFQRAMNGEASRLPLTRSKVTIEELKEDLTTGVKLIKVFLPKQREFEIVDPAHDKDIMLARGDELVIQMYKDYTRRPSQSSPIEWEMAYDGTCLDLAFIENDDHRQKYYFRRLSSPRRYGETVRFRRGMEKRNIHVHMQEEWDFPHNSLRKGDGIIGCDDCA